MTGRSHFSNKPLPGISPHGEARATMRCGARVFQRTYAMHAVPKGYEHDEEIYYNIPARGRGRGDNAATNHLWPARQIQHLRAALKVATKDPWAVNGVNDPCN